MSAGVLDGRVWTGLHNIASEKPNSWIQSGRGTYVDQQIVQDADLITSRYPQDTPVLGFRIAEELAARGGRPLPEKTGIYALIVPKGFDPHVRWSLTSPLRILGFQLMTAESLDQLAEKGVESIQGVIRIQKGGTIETSHPVFGDLSTTMVSLPPGEFTYPNLLPTFLTFAEKHGKTKEVIPSPQPEVAIVLSEGADEKVVLALQTYFEAQGQQVVLTGLEKGWIHGVGGMPLEVTTPLTDLQEMKVVVAPGGLWPEHKPDARQGEKAEWIEAQAEKDRARLDWISSQLDGGAEGILVGLDALRLGRTAPFKGKKFATTRQAQWSFGKEGGKFSSEPFLKSDERLWSISSYETIPLWIRAQHLSE